MNARTWLMIAHVQRALFDVAVAGPAASMALSLVLLVVGLHRTSVASLGQLALFPLVDGGGLAIGSLLTGACAAVFLPALLLASPFPTAPVPVHPLVLAGCAG